MKFSPTELLIVLVVVLVLFGGALLPKIFKNIKDSKKAFKDGVEELKKNEE